MKISKKDECVKFKNFQKKIKTLFVIYANFGSILLPEDNVRKN